MENEKITNITDYVNNNISDYTNYTNNISNKNKNYDIDLSKEYVATKYSELYITKKLSLKDKIARHLIYNKHCKLCKKLLKNEFKQNKLFKEMHKIQSQIDRVYDKLGNY